MNDERLQQLIAQFGSRRIAVIGDFFLDKYLDTDPALVETSVETGLNANQVVAVRRSPGAAGTVVNNLAALGIGTLHAIGAVGNDGEAFDLKKGLEQFGCKTEGLLQFGSLMTPTYLKPRDLTDASLAGEHERYDTKNRTPTDAAVATSVLAALDAVLPDVDAVIIVDQVDAADCGVVTSVIRDELAERARKFAQITFWADSRKHIQLFRNVIIKPNQFETVGLQHPKPDDRVELDELKAALPRLRKQTGGPVCVTLGERGMLVSDPEPTVIPTIRVEGPVDTTGAGDAATAGAVSALAAGATLYDAALIGNLVASITIQQLATTGTASSEQLTDRLTLWRSQHETAET